MIKQFYDHIFMQKLTLEQVIRRNIRLPHHPNSSGWYPVVCKVCNDHGRKGPRGGFRFDKQVVGYHCFNCGHVAKFEEGNRRISRNMKVVLTAFGVPEEEWKDVIVANFQQDEYVHVNQTSSLTKTIEPEEIELPSCFYPLYNNPDDDWAEIAITYLNERGLTNWQDYSFYLCALDDHPLVQFYYGRLIIPVYKEKKLIFYTGRDLTKVRKRKYLSVNIPRTNILYGFDELSRNTDEPLYIVEGWFDAVLIDGVCVFGNRLLEGQIKWLNLSPRKKVVIPDKRGNGHLLALDGLKQGWSVSTPDIGECKDINDAVNKYGLIYTLKTIRDNIADDSFRAETNVRLYCEKSATI